MRLTLVIAAVVAVGVAAWWWRTRSPSAGRPSARHTIDPFTLGEPWRRHVQAALGAQRRYREIVGGVRPGPLRDRLDEIGQQVAQAVVECDEVAARGDEIDAALAHLNVPSLERQLDGATDDAARSSITAQLAAAQRMRATREEIDRQLRLQVVRMGELTALAAEVGVGTHDTELLGVGVNDVVVQLEGLRQAVQEVQQPGRPATSP